MKKVIILKNDNFFCKKSLQFLNKKRTSQVFSFLLLLSKPCIVMISFPNAKINLGLHITKKRNDGYHDIETCMVPIPLCDALEMIVDKTPSWNVTGLAVPGDPKDNLILKAEKLLKKDFRDSLRYRFTCTSTFPWAPA